MPLTSGNNREESTEVAQFLLTAHKGCWRSRIHQRMIMVFRRIPASNQCDGPFLSSFWNMAIEHRNKPSLVIMLGQHGMASTGKGLFQSTPLC